MLTGTARWYINSSKYCVLFAAALFLFSLLGYNPKDIKWGNSSIFGEFHFFSQWAVIFYSLDFIFSILLAIFIAGGAGFSVLSLLDMKHPMEITFMFIIYLYVLFVPKKTNKQKSICTNAPNKYHLLRLIQIIIIKIIFSNFCFPICGSRCQNYVTMPAHLWWFLCGSTIFLCHLVKSNQWNNFQWTCCRLKQTEKQKSNEWSLMSAWAVFCPSSLNHINSIKWKHHKK